MLVTELIIFVGVIIVGLLGYWIGRTRGYDDGYGWGYHDGKNWAVTKLAANAPEPKMALPKSHAFWCYAGDHIGPCPSHSSAL